ncbi:MAG: hypothetical protein WCP21_12350, partial [Armatimonadota bacterium]
LRALDELIIPALRRAQPQILVVSAGYDGHATDPLAQHELTCDGYYQIMLRLRQAAEELCEGRLCVVLEGGYEPQALAHGVENTALALLGEPLREPDATLPEVHPLATERVDDALGQIIEIHTTRLAL